MSIDTNIQDCIFCAIGDKEDVTFIKDFGNWIYRIKPSQFLLGASVLVHKDHKEGLTALSSSEIAEALDIIKLVEFALKQSFQPDWFNYLQTNNAVRHLHFHIIPRYKQQAQFAGEVFVDNNYNGMPEESYRVVSESVAKMIIQTIQDNFEA